MNKSKKRTSGESGSLPKPSGTEDASGVLTDSKGVPVPELKVVMTNPSDLQYHPENKKYYGEPRANEKLLENIKLLGIQQPLVANTDGTVLQGNSRLCIAKSLGIPQVPVIRVDIPNHIDQLEWILSGNVQRDKTNEERAREFEGHLEIESARAKIRQATNVKEVADTEASAPAKQKGPTSERVKNSAQGEKGKSREFAANKVGWSGPTAENAAAVVKVIDRLKAEEPNSDVAADLIAKLNLSVHSATMECKRKGLILESKKGKGTEDVLNVKFTTAGRSYASRQFKPFTEEGTLDEKQMAFLKLVSPPDSGDDRVLKSLVALPMGFDPLAEGVTDAVIAAFNAELKAAPKWSCLIETRSCDRAAKVNWPDNAWVGLVASTQTEIDTAISAADKVQAGMVWLHCRIDSEGLSAKSLGAFDWVVISLANEDVVWEDVEPIYKMGRKEKIPVFFDSSVKCRPQELPKRKPSTIKPNAAAA